MDIKVLSRQRFGRQSPARELFNHLLVCLVLHLLGNFFWCFVYNCSHFQLLTIMVCIDIYFIGGQLQFL